MARRTTIHTPYRLALLLERLDRLGEEWLEARVRGDDRTALEEEIAAVTRASRRTEERLRRG